MNDAGRPRPAHVQLLAVSWNFGWPIAAGVGIGYWIDEHLGTSPLASLGLGLGAMIASISRLIRLSQEEARERRELEAIERAAVESARTVATDAAADGQAPATSRGTRRRRRGGPKGRKT